MALIKLLDKIMLTTDHNFMSMRKRACALYNTRFQSSPGGWGVV